MAAVSSIARSFVAKGSSLDLGHAIVGHEKKASEDSV